MSASVVLLICLTAVSVPIIICTVRSKVYSGYIAGIDSKKFSGRKYYGLGFALIDMFRINFNTASVHKIREQSGILFGRKYADFYVRVLYAQTFTYCAIFIYAALFIGCLVGDMDGVILAFLGLVSAAAIYAFYMNSYSNRLKELNDKYMTDFPNAVSTIALLVNAGMFLRDAWKQVAYSSDTPLYMQMRIVIEDMSNGMNEADAIFAFANRCSTKEIRKFCTLIIQAIEKGGRDLTSSLTQQAALLMNEKKQFALQQGEKAASKLLAPIMFIFIGVIIMIMVPIMSTMSM